MLHDVIITAILFLALDRHHREKEKFFYVRYPYPQHTEIPLSSLPAVPPNHARVIVVGDTHERHEGLGQFPECDIFVHCGDILMTGRFFSEKTQTKKLMRFNNWLATIPAKKRIVIAGNHDKQILVMGKEKTKLLLSNCEYLENEATTYGPLRIWGTPVSVGRSKNTAFQTQEFKEETKKVCPSEVDILITHGTLPELENRIKHKIHFCGHNHNSYGIYHKTSNDGKGFPRMSLCAPVHDGHYRLRHLPMIMDVPYEAFHDQATMESFRNLDEQVIATNSSSQDLSSNVIINVAKEKQKPVSSAHCLPKVYGFSTSVNKIRPASS